MRTQIKYLVGTDSLLKILELSLDAESSYEQLRIKTRNPNTIDWLKEKQELTTDFILNILRVLQDFEISPQAHSFLKLNLNKVWMDVKLKFITIDDNLVIRECQKIDNNILKALNHEIKLGLTTEKIHELYTNYKNKLRSYPNPITLTDLQIS